VREALRMLESRGLIESRGSGTFVVAAWRNPFQEPLSVVVAGEDVDRAQLFEVRRLLEAEAAALAAKRRTIDQLNLMHETTDDMEIELDSAERFIAADIRYHLAIAEATGNRLLLRLMQAIREGLTEMFGTVFKFPGGPERSVAQHRLINEAIEAEDAERARQLMTEHILRVEQELAEIDD
jgi:GntR family transcriptional repressor for pyruvate dehydrogenase complex